MTLTKTLAATGLVLTLTLAAAASQAALLSVNRSWSDAGFNAVDPQFGNTGTLVQQLGWRGSYALRYDETCTPAAGSGLHTVAVDPASSCAAGFGSLSVELFAQSNPGTLLGRLTPRLPPTLFGLRVDQLLFDGDLLLGLVSSVPVVQGLDPGADLRLSDPYNWSLRFSAGGPTLRYDWGDCPHEGTAQAFQCSGSSASLSPPPSTGVPEPAGLALSLGALAAAGWFSQRRKVKPSHAGGSRPV